MDGALRKSTHNLKQNDGAADKALNQPNATYPTPGG